jgi:hypothetical protein
MIRNSENMKTKALLVSCILLVLAAVSVPPAAADTSASAASYVYVSAVEMDPEVYYPYEQGTVTVTLSNAGNTTIGVTNPNLLSSSNDISIIKEDKWQTLSYIGAGNSISYTFVVTANGLDGKYFALFSIETKDGQNLHYPVTFTVDSEDIHAAISKKPETFTLDSSAEVNLSLINPREGAIKSIVITTETNGADITPTQTFISELEANSAAEIPFTITPHAASNVTFHVAFQNGDEDRIIDVVLPLKMGNDKTAAVPTINNLAVTSLGSSYDLTGDITNTGITDANGMVVTVATPATGTGTYPEYAVGSLAADDSSSFEVTFTSTDLSSVPLLFKWKDSDGTDYSVIKTLDLSAYASSGGMPSASTTSDRSSSSSSSMMQGPGGMSGGPNGGPGGSSSSSSVLSSITNPKGGLSSFYPVIAMIALIVVGVVAYKKRKWILSKIKKQ